MAVKKTHDQQRAKAAAPKKAAPKKAAAPEDGGGPEGRGPRRPPPKKAAPKKKAAPVKLTDKQTELLKKVTDAGEAGYPADSKATAKGLESLQTKKLIKRGRRTRRAGTYRYRVSKAGEKHLSTPRLRPE